MFASKTHNQVRTGIIHWYRDATDPIEIDLLDLSFPCNHYVAKMPSWLVNIYPGSTETLIAMAKMVSESATRDRLETAAFSGLITQYRYLLK
jgi:hypothetical protein